ncbi:NERD domain-containing protein [Micromonospora rubida]|uniref:NERD domain-containing protein n=1 Tax=Micromonospora rubida TaxID=2697657 RepID=UPI001376DF27|nr:NERD domain-containing protein [Micromonospora rubida]NBE83595.1 hypothetical protein [Micromonospora rubida]
MREGRWTTITPSQFAHEREALAHVQALLPDTEPYRAWSNFTFTAQTGHPYEVDLLVAAPSGLYLIEIKSLTGRLVSSGSNWILHGPNGTRTFDNPLHLADAKAKKLKALLQTVANQDEVATGQHKGRRTGPPVRIPFVQAAVFLAKPGLTVALSENHLHGVYGPEPAPGHQPGDLPTIGSLLRRPPQDERHRVTRELSAALPGLLNDVGIARSRKHYQVGAWELETRPFDLGPTWQDHHVRHRDLEREHRRIRIYLVERNAVQAERASIERAAKREMLALHGISHPPGAHQHLPGALDPQEVQTATTPQEGPGGLGTDRESVPQVLRPLGLGQHTPDDQDGKSGVTGDCHAPFRGSPGVRFPRAIRPPWLLGNLA